MKFVNLLLAVNYPTSNQQKQELWDVEGIIKKHSNQKFKFDIDLDNELEVIEVENIDQVLEYILVDHDIKFNKVCG